MISSTLKMATVRAICPAMAFASSVDEALSIAAADTAMDTVRCCRLTLQRHRCIHSSVGPLILAIKYQRSSAQYAALSVGSAWAPCIVYRCFLGVPGFLLGSPIELSLAVWQRAFLGHRQFLSLLVPFIPHLYPVETIERFAYQTSRQSREGFTAMQSAKHIPTPRFTAIIF